MQPRLQQSPKRPRPFCIVPRVGIEHLTFESSYDGLLVLQHFGYAKVSYSQLFQADRVILVQQEGGCHGTCNISRVLDMYLVQHTHVKRSAVHYEALNAWDRGL